MTELAVAIVVLGIVLVGLFPLVVDSIRLAVQNAEVAQADRVVATQLDSSREQISAAACAAETAQPLTLASPENEKFQATRTVTCAANGLATVTVQVQLLSDTATTVAEATTQVATTD